MKLHGEVDMGFPVAQILVGDYSSCCFCYSVQVKSTPMFGPSLELLHNTLGVGGGGRELCLDQFFIHGAFH